MLNHQDNSWHVKCNVGPVNLVIRQDYKERYEQLNTLGFFGADDASGRGGGHVASFSSFYLFQELLSCKRYIYPRNRSSVERHQRMLVKLELHVVRFSASLRARPLKQGCFFKDINLKKNQKLDGISQQPDLITSRLHCSWEGCTQSLKTICKENAYWLWVRRLMTHNIT